MSQEKFKVSGQDVVKKIKEIIEEGNATRITVEDEKGKVIAEFPLTIGAIGLVFAPVLAAIGAIAALVTNCTITVEKKD